MAEIKWTASMREAHKKRLINEAKGKPVCYICKGPIDLRLPGTNREGFTCEHIIPRHKAPELTNSASNIVAAHKRCNSAKGTKTSEEARAQAARALRGTRENWR